MIPEWKRKRATINRYERSLKSREKVNAKHRARQEKSKEKATLHCARWDELEDALLLEKAEHMTYRQLAKEFGRTHYAIETRLRKLRGGCLVCEETPQIPHIEKAKAMEITEEQFCAFAKILCVGSESEVGGGGAEPVREDADGSAEEGYNDPKLSDRGVRRGTCRRAERRRWSAAGAVTHGAVRCSAWFGDFIR
jgi:hypothetical protein